MTERIKRVLSEQRKPIIRPLLCTRREAMVLLACSMDSLEKLEQQGRLTPIRFDQGKVRYNLSQLEALARGEV
jgi:hypothetical protein